MFVRVQIKWFSRRQSYIKVSQTFILKVPFKEMKKLWPPPTSLLKKLP